MQKIEKIQRYIDKTSFSNTRYDMNIKELFEIAQMQDRLRAINLAFQYGQAKGYRAAKAEITAESRTSRNPAHHHV